MQEATGIREQPMGTEQGSLGGEGEGELRQRKEGKGLRDAESQQRRQEHDECGHLG